MKKLLKLARPVGLGCVAGMMLTIYGIENGAVAFWLTLSLLICLSVCILIAVTDSILDAGRPWKSK